MILTCMIDSLDSFPKHHPNFVDNSTGYAGDNDYHNVIVGLAFVLLIAACPVDYSTDPGVLL